MTRILSDEELEEIKEALEYINDVGPVDSVIQAALLGDFDEYTYRGDDGASFYWHLNRLMEIFNIETDIMKRYSKIDT